MEGHFSKDSIEQRVQAFLNRQTPHPLDADSVELATATLPPATVDRPAATELPAPTPRRTRTAPAASARPATPQAALATKPANPPIPLFPKPAKPALIRPDMLLPASSRAVLNQVKAPRLSFPPPITLVQQKTAAVERLLTGAGISKDIAQREGRSLAVMTTWQDFLRRSPEGTGATLADNYLLAKPFFTIGMQHFVAVAEAVQHVLRADDPVALHKAESYAAEVVAKKVFPQNRS